MDVQRGLDRLGGEWSIVGPLAGGYQQGATLVRWADGDGVLKVVKTNWDAGQWAATAAVIEGARANGWPTPAWIAHGLLDDSSAFVLMEYVDGETPKVLTAALLDQLLEVLDRQRGLRPRTAQDYSSYLRTVVVPGSYQASTVGGFSPVGARFVDRVLGLVGEPAVLGVDDVVHGDFAPNNTLVRAGKVGAMIDCVFVGKGDALMDASSLAYWVHAWDEEGDHVDAARVVDAVVEFGGGESNAGAIVSCVAHVRGALVRDEALARLRRPAYCEVRAVGRSTSTRECVVADHLVLTAGAYARAVVARRDQDPRCESRGRGNRF